MKKPLFLLSALLLFACNETKKPQNAQEIVDASIAYHGMGNLYDAEFNLTFRDMAYTYKMHDGRYEYTRTQTDSTGATIIDVLNNDGLVRTIDGKEATLTAERNGAYSRSVNSVIYFFRLPYGLNDDAVRKTYNGEVEVDGKKYHEVRVTFAQEGGGDHFEDVFLYWFDDEDYSMDYMAYLYYTDGGGLRMRKAINPRRVSGMLIQDYINLKPANDEVTIEGIREAYNQGELVELSRIINEDVQIDL
jgi:hypothetical protein